MVSAFTVNIVKMWKALAKTRISALLKKGYSVKGLTTSGAGDIDASLTGDTAKGASASKTVTIAKGKRKVGRRGTWTVKLKLTKAGRKLLKKSRRAKVKLTVGFKPKGGRRSKRTSPAVKLKR